MCGHPRWMPLLASLQCIQCLKKYCQYFISVICRSASLTSYSVTTSPSFTKPCLPLVLGDHALPAAYCPSRKLLILIPIAIGSSFSTQTFSVEATWDCPWVQFLPHVTLSHYPLSRYHLYIDDFQIHVANISSLWPKEWYIQVTSSTLKYSILNLSPKFPQPPVFSMLKPSTVNIEARCLNVDLSIPLYLPNAHCTSHHSRKVSRDFGVSLSTSTYSSIFFSPTVARIIIWNKVWSCYYTG